MTMRIGIHTWEPGLAEGDEQVASSGGASWLSYLIRELTESGNQVVFISNDKIKVKNADVIDARTLITRFSSMIDTIFMPWRWSMPQYADRHKLYQEQFVLIDEMKAKVVIHDEDQMMEPDDKSWVISKGCTITTPALFPPVGCSTLHFPYPFSDYDLPTKAKTLDSCDYGLLYVGNNYSRFEQSVEFLHHYRGIQVAAAGNWLEASPNRESPEVVRHALPHVNFIGRVPNNRVRHELANAFATVHLCKEGYGQAGFMTMRWAEAASAGTLGFIPAMFKLPQMWYNQFNRLGLIVSNGAELRLGLLSYAKDQSKYVEAIDMQREFVKAYMQLDAYKILTSRSSE